MIKRWIFTKRVGQVQAEFLLAIYGKEQKAKNIILAGYDFKKDGDSRLDLLEEYKKTCFFEERAIKLKSLVKYFFSTL